MTPRISTAWLSRNAVAFLALFVALGGTGYAAATINGKQIKNSTSTASGSHNAGASGPAAPSWHAARPARHPARP